MCLGISFYLSFFFVTSNSPLHASFHWSILKQYIGFTRIILITDVFQTERKRRRSEKQTSHFICSKRHLLQRKRENIYYKIQKKKQKKKTLHNKIKRKVHIHETNKQTNEQNEEKKTELFGQLAEVAFVANIYDRPRSTNVNTTYSIH